ncbi:gas vesicle protein [Candidatus Parcubacteria bacterium]|nr:gas vesicle protein [Candidatus Parcubacteria bacterium]
MSKSKKRKKNNNNKEVEIIQDKQSKIQSMATTKEVIEKAKKELADLTGFKKPAAVGSKKEGNDWFITIEVVEKESIPDGMDVLGTYEVRVDPSGSILSYERTDLRKRIDTALDKEV